MKLLDASKIDRLFTENPRKGQGLFPELIKKLIIASVNKFGYLRFPSSDAIWNTGFDGILTDIESDCNYVPNGNSLWELGTNKKVFTKFNEDFDKRSKEETSFNKLDYIFILCTPKIISDSNKIINWTTDKNNLNIWKRVVIIDANSLENWLESNIEIAIWLLSEFGQHYDSDKITILNSEYERIKTLTNPNISLDLLSCSNDNIINDFHNLINSKKLSGFISIFSPVGFEHAYFFIIGSLIKMNDCLISSEVVIVKDQASLNLVKKACNSKIVVIAFRSEDEYLDNNNLYIIIVANEKEKTDINLNYAKFNEFEKCLENININRKECYNLTSKINRNISCFKRLFAVNPLIKQPKWAVKEKREEIIPIALVSSIEINKEYEMQIIEELADSDYSETLEKWLNVEDPPIFKYDYKYFINSKEEAIKVLQLSCNSSKVKKAKKIVYEALTNINEYSRNLINGLLESFAIIANSDTNNDFDDLIENIINECKTDKELLLNILEYFPIFSEISAKNTLNYLENAIDSNDDVFKEVIEKDAQWPYTSNYSYYIIWTLQSCIRREETCAQALRIYLKLYLIDYKLPNSIKLQNDIEKFFAPTTSGIVAMKASRKFQLLESFISNENKSKCFNIIKKLTLNKTNFFMVPAAPKWISIDEEKFKPTMAELYQVNDLAYNWMKNNIEDKFLLIKKLIEGIRDNSKDNNNENFDLIYKLIKELNDDESAELNHYVLNKIYDIERFSENNEIWQYQSQYIGQLEELYDKTLPTNLFLRYKYIFKYSTYNLPILNPNNITENDEEKYKQIYIKKCVDELLNYYGQNIILNIMGICDDRFDYVDCIIDATSQHKDIIKKLIERDKKLLIIKYLNKLKENNIIEIFENLTNNEKNYILPLLPFNNRIIDYIDGHEYEEYYWKNRYLGNCGTELFEKAFSKYIIFSPFNLLPNFAYGQHKPDYDKSITLLKSISKKLNSEELEGNIEYLYAFIKKLDRLYYSEELSKIELSIISLYTYKDDYPYGIKNYFWENPSQFVYFVTNAMHNKDSTDLYGLISIETGNKCWIPSENIIKNPDKFKKWIDEVVQLSQNFNDEENELLEICIVNILALCPENENQTIWPNKVVADTIENLAKNYDRRKDLAAIFYCRKSNRNIGRFVGDGTEELKMYEKFKTYSKHYEPTNPTIALALEYCAESCKSDSERDRKHAIINDF